MTKTKTYDAFYVGQRVAANRYGVVDYGTVTRTAQGVRTRLTDGVIVWVWFDKTTRQTWMHGASLEVVSSLDT